MKKFVTLLILTFSSGAIYAQTQSDSEDSRSIPVKQWEFDYYNYGVSAGQEAVYLIFTMALRYNLDTLPVDVGG